MEKEVEKDVEKDVDKEVALCPEVIGSVSITCCSTLLPSVQCPPCPASTSSGSLLTC